MTTQTTRRNLSECRREAREAVQHGIDTDRQIRACVLRRDGDTEVYYSRGRRILVKREAGWVTGGSHVDPCDTPCVR